MGFAMPHAKFSPGFRLSTFDRIILAAGILMTPVTSYFHWWMGLAVAIPVIAFFFFCNVFRISRIPELVWAVIYTTLASATVLWETPGWWPTVAVSGSVAMVAIGLEMRSPSYHGIAWQRINPGLPEWWAARPENKEH
jgi:hypothetical protein